MDPLEQLLSERPSFHSSETEIDRPFAPKESLLSYAAAQQVANGALTCYGIGSDVLSFLGETIRDNSRTLETGAGLSTLVFAIRRATHVAITPSRAEIERIREYAEQHGIAMDTVEFVAESSDRSLPRLDTQDLDLVLLDGKHAFPWPIVDWFYTADRLRRGGVMLVDDVQMRSVGILAEFMRVDPGWELLHDFSRKALAFRKTRELAHNVAWHMQPWTMVSLHNARLSLFLRLRRRLHRLVSRS